MGRSGRIVLCPQHFARPREHSLAFARFSLGPDIAWTGWTASSALSHAMRCHGASAGSRRCCSSAEVHALQLHGHNGQGLAPAEEDGDPHFFYLISEMTSWQIRWTTCLFEELVGAG